MTIESTKIIDYSKRLDDKGETGFSIEIKGTSAKRQQILREAVAFLKSEIKPVDCPRAPHPFRYCPDCDGSFPCQLPHD